MKRFCSAGLLALSWMLASQDHASAWVNFKFSAGINWQWQSGGNSVLWGAWRNGPPGCEAFGQNCAYPNYHAANAAGPNGFVQQGDKGQPKAQGQAYAAPQYPYYGFTPTVPPQYQHYQPAAPPAAPPAAKAPATTTSQSSADDTVPGYSNFYGQFYHYQPVYLPTSYQAPRYRVGVSFGE
jgi:hypothetical protein